jgi:hypothetical protein
MALAPTARSSFRSRGIVLGFEAGIGSRSLKPNRSA